MSRVKASFDFDFEAELTRVLARAERLRAAVAGKANITKVQVKAHKVKAHDRAAHTRYVIKVRQ